MMTKKLVENWIVWVVVDVVYIGMFIYKQLYVTSFLYFVFLVLAVMGYRQWKATLHEPELVTRTSRLTAQIPTAGPTERIANAHRHPLTRAIAGTSCIGNIVSRKPSET
jgi:hypothetical protein